MSSVPNTRSPRVCAVVLILRSTRLSARPGLKSPPEMKTMEFKKEFIDGLVAKYKPRKINMWEDRPNHLEEFSRFLLEKKQLQGIDFEVSPFHFTSLCAR
jgi:hypothetical protein